MEKNKNLENHKKWGLTKANPKIYGAYASILVVVGYLLSSARWSGLLLSIIGDLMIVLGIIYFILWIRYKMRKNK